MSEETTPRPRRGVAAWSLTVIVVVAVAAGVGVGALIGSIGEKKGEASVGFTEVVAIDDATDDPAVWGENFPRQYDLYQKTADFTPTAHSTALVPRTPTAEDPRGETTQSKLTEDPRLVTLWNGYAFALDYRHLRGHAYTLTDQRFSRRVLEKSQPGACLNCHASTVSIFADLGSGDPEAGFAALNKMPYSEAAQLAQHPVACIDCHEPTTMKLRVTRPALVEGLKNLKASQGIAGYDVNRDATTQEMRSFVCAQCHVEYYFAGDAKTLTFPWSQGLDLNDVYRYYQDIDFADFPHAETGTRVLKAQHPEFEAWSAGVHAANGVTCADCHMNYTRVGATKVSNHDIVSPMADVNGSCGVCHTASDQVLRDRVTVIQNRFVDSRDRALDAVTQLIAALQKAGQDGVTPADRIAAAQEYQRFASFYVDYAYSENSYGFHAPDYFQRLLNQSLDAARTGQLILLGVAPAEVAPSDVAAANQAQAEASGLGLG